MQLSTSEALILPAAFRARQRLAGRDPWQPGIPRTRLGAYRTEILNARDGLIPLSLADWIGHMPTQNERVLYCRAYASLEAKGLAERVSLYGARRTTHLKLTEQGEALARKLLAADETAGGG